MNLFRSIVVLLWCLTASLQCGEKKPVQCTTCSGIGKIITRAEKPAEFEIVSAESQNKGFFNPDYYIYVTVKNLSNKGGNFTLVGSWIYKTIGTHTERTVEYIEPHATKKMTVRYDADNVCDETKYQVTPPTIIETSEKICPVCNGEGVMKKK